MRDPTDTALIDAEDAETARLRQAQLARERDDFRWLMAHAQGRRIVWRYLAAGGVFRTTHVFGDINGRDSALNEGRRQIALQLLDDVMTHAPAQYGKMVDESVLPIE